MSVTTASKGRKPPSCCATSTPFTKTRAWWVAEPKRMAMSLPLHSPGTKKSVSYQKSPQYSRDSLSVKKSQKEAGTGMEMDSGRPFAQSASTPSLLGSKRKRHMPSRLTTRREVEATGYSRDLLFIAGTSFLIILKHFELRNKPLRHRCAMPPPLIGEALAVPAKDTVSPEALRSGELSSECETERLIPQLISSGISMTDFLQKE